MSGYSEDALVEQPAIKLLAELGWEVRSGAEISSAKLNPTPFSRPAYVRPSSDSTRMCRLKP